MTWETTQKTTHNPLYLLPGEGRPQRQKAEQCVRMQNGAYAVQETAGRQ